MRPKKFLFIIDSPFPYYAGGIENWLFNVSKRLVANYEVTIISSSPTVYKKAFYEIPSGVEVINYFSLRKYGLYRRLCKTYWGYVDSSLRAFVISRKINHIIRRDPKDFAVIALTTLSGASAALKSKRKYPDICYVCSARGPHAELVSRANPQLKRLWYTIEKTNLTCADVALTNGYDTQDYFRKYGIDTEVMKNGVDVKKFFEAPEEKPYPTSELVVISVGTLYDVKCIKELIEAVAIVFKSGVKNISLYFAGKGNPSKYEMLANELGIAERVHFLGHRTDLPILLKNADVIACLSEGGGFSMAALESMASGTPVIAWNTPVYRQFNRNGQCIKLVEFKNVQHLANGISSLLVKNNENLIMIQNAQKQAALFDWSCVIEQLVEYVNR